MQLLNELGSGPGSATMLDVAGLDPEAGSLMMWHCGVSPRNIANSDGIRWVEHSTLGRKSADGPFGVAGDMVFGAQETTITYLGDSGWSLLVLGSQIIEREQKGIDGTRGWISEFKLNREPIDTWDLINTINVLGLQHHFCVGHGDFSQELLEVGAWLKMDLVRKISYQDYLQIEGVNT